MSVINIEDVTTGTVEGTGTFDKLMSAMTAHLDVQYDKNRIKDTEYAKVYIALQEQAMQQALAFTLGSEIAGKQADLLAAQILSETSKQNQTNQQTSNLTAEALNIPKQGLLLDRQAVLSSTENTKTLAEIDLLGKQEDKIDQDILTAVEQTAKMLAETDFIKQKTYTEEAQISDTANGVAVTGVISKQKDLYAQQKQGYIRDAEQKAAKIAADGYAVQRSTDPEGVNTPAALNETGVNGIIQTLYANVNN